MRKLVCAALLALCLSAATPDPVTWKVEAAPKPVKAGGRFTVRLLAAIQDSWHVYSMKPMEDGPIPTQISIVAGQPFQLAAPIKADAPQTLQDPTLKMEVELYEGTAGFELPVKVAGGATPGTVNMVVSASYQSCNNKMCLAPKTVKVEVPVTIAK
jgi:thiol:disulfide interchange protein DsbD